MEPFPAHIRVDCDEQGNHFATVQSVGQHCRSTANYARRALLTAGLPQMAYLAGLVHDAGKYTERFRAYLERSARGEPVRRGMVNHTFAGVRLLLETYHRGNGEIPDVACELLSLAAGGHHGLFDCVDDHQKNGFVHRKTKPDIDYEEAISNFYQFCADKQELNTYFEAAMQELEPVINRICEMTGEDADDRQYEEETAFYMGLLSRLLLSAVIEGDRRDTAEFLNAAEFPAALDEQTLEKLWADCLLRVEEKLKSFPQDTGIQRARAMISDQCRAFGKRPGGVLRLNVPTGGGKTLSSLRYALVHAKKWHKQRIVFTSPLLSILEQNAQVIRDFVQDDSIILEHHSNLPQTEENQEALDTRELLTQTYDAPIIITTLVQLLHTLFSGKTTAVRRFHALCGSIIIIDEVQTVPSRLLSMFSLAVNFLSEICGATVVLCSATQPCIEKIHHPLHQPILDIVPYDPAVWAEFRRTEIRDAGNLSMEEIITLSLDILYKSDSLLIICNKKDEAEQLFRRLKAFGGNCYHLSAAMCMAHRRIVLEDIKASLKKGDAKTLCIATQVIEAGVDISFAQVLRFSAGMDSVVQAAGRCNRNGEAGDGSIAPVHLVQCQNESLQHLPDIQAGKDATLALLCEYRLSPADFQHSLLSDASIAYYYQSLYRTMPRGHQDYKIAKKPYTLFSLLSRNEKYANATLPGFHEYYFHQAFRLAGALFQVFDEDTIDVIVPYETGGEIVKNLCSARAKVDMPYVKTQLDRAKSYTISLYRYQVEVLQKEHALVPLCGGALMLLNHYNENTGFSMEKQTMDFGTVK